MDITIAGKKAKNPITPRYESAIPNVWLYLKMCPKNGEEYESFVSPIRAKALFYL